jgi:WD40 repeat protein
MERQILARDEYDAGGVLGVALSPNGRVLATIVDRAPKLWDASSGQQRAELPVSGAISRWHAFGPGLAFSRDGTLVGACGCAWKEKKRTGRAVIWDARSGHRVLAKEETQPDSEYTDMCFGPDGKTVYALARVCPEDYSKATANLRAWETTSGRNIPLNLSVAGLNNIGSWYFPSGFDVPARFFQESRTFLYRTQRAQARRAKTGLQTALDEQWVIFDLATRRDLRFNPFPGFFSGVPLGEICALSPDGRIVCLCNPQSGGLAFVNVANGEKRQWNERINPPRIKTGVWSPDGSKLAILTDHGPRIWDVKSERELVPRGRLLGGPDAVRFSPDGKFLAIGAVGGMSLWDLAARTEVRFHGADRTVDLSPDGRLLAIRQGDGSVKVLEVATGRERSVLPKATYPPDEHHPGGFSADAIAFSLGGDAIGLGYDNGVVEVRDGSTGRLIKTYSGSAQNVQSIMFSPDGRWIAAASTDTSKYRAASEGLRAEIETMLWANRSKSKRSEEKSAGGRSYDVVVLWDALTGAIVREIPGMSGPLAFSPDGTMLAATSFAGAGANVIGPILDTRTGKLRQVLVGSDANQGGSPTFAPDGMTVATSGWDGAVRLWDVATGGERAAIRLCRPGGHINQVAFSPTGRYLATANGNGTVYILKVRDR